MEWRVLHPARHLRLLPGDDGHDDGDDDDDEPWSISGDRDCPTTEEQVDEEEEEEQEEELARRMEACAFVF